jgi:hypothetical protein
MAPGTRPSNWQAARSVIASARNRLLAWFKTSARQHRFKLASNHLRGHNPWHSRRRVPGPARVPPPAGLRRRIGYSPRQGPRERRSAQRWVSTRGAVRFAPGPVEAGDDTRPPRSGPRRSLLLSGPEKRNGGVPVVNFSGLGAEEPDHRHRRLLRPQHQRRRRRRTTEPRDEIASSHPAPLTPHRGSLSRSGLPVWP